LSLTANDAILDYASETLETEAAERWKTDGADDALNQYLQPLLLELGYH